MGPVRQNPIQRTVRSVHMCALHCAQLLHTILHRTDLIIFPLTLQIVLPAPSPYHKTSNISITKITHNCLNTATFSLVKAKFHYAVWSQTGPKLVADLQRAEIWPII